MAIVNQGNWCQASVSTGAPGIRTASAILKREGYQVRVVSLGHQVTSLGTMKLTMLDIRKGTHEDTCDVTDILRAHIPELR